MRSARRASQGARRVAASFPRALVGGDLEQVAVGIAEVDGLEATALEDLRARHAASAQVVAPRDLLVGRADLEGEVMDTAATLAGLVHLRVLHERDERAGRAERVAEPEVARAGIVGVVLLGGQREAQHV